MTAPVRAVIVDDEPLARETIEALLEGHPEVEVCASCPDGPSALMAIARHRPDLLFLDIQMPGMNGFELLEACMEGGEISSVPFVIFVTGFDEFALQAFEYHAVDYLLKPFSDDRFARALDHAKRQVLAGKPGEFARKVESLLREYAGRDVSGGATGQRFAVKERGTVVFIDTADIVWFEAAEHYVLVHTETRSHIIRESMSGLEARLEANRFLRVHRSAIVNVDFIERLDTVVRDEYELRLKTGRTLRVSRRRCRKLKELLGV